MNGLFKKKINGLINSSFAKNILLITGGTVFAQILNTLIYPIITRLYTPEDLGILTLFTAAIGLMSIGTLNYEKAIPIEADEKNAVSILIGSLFVLSIFTISAGFILMLWGDGLLSLFGLKQMSNYKMFLPIGIFFIGLYETFQQWCFRIKSYKSISKTKISQSLSKNITTLVFGIASKGSVGLIIGHIVGTSAGFINLSIPFLKDKKNLIRSNSIKTTTLCLKRYKSFPLYTTPSHFLGSLGNKLPSILIASFYGVEFVGYYGLAYAIVNLPSILVGKAIGDVFYGEAASFSNSNPKRIEDLSQKLLVKLFVFALIPTIILLLFGKELFSFIFGSNWADAGVYASILAVYIAIRLVVSPISRVYEIFEKQKIKLLIDIFRVFIVVVSFGISKYANLNSYWAIGLYSFSMSIVHLITYFVAQKIIRDSI